uniref:Malate dehydrogenase, cytoplasmic n=1 Tax=Myxobolus squamalis TaxID=59785 RepID=A0A6B2FYX4_MYXSQ
MTLPVIRVLITGSAGRIAYSLIPLIGLGHAFGPEQKLDLVLFDIPEKIDVLRGIMMEIDDCSYSLINSVSFTANPEEAFLDIDFAIFLGSYPRKEWMQRKDLLEKNKIIFKQQAMYLQEYSKKNVKVVVVGNPANTNALVLAENSTSIPKENITCLMRLDQNRATSIISKKLSIPKTDIFDIIIWGNHSNFQNLSLEHTYLKNKGIFQPDDSVKEWINTTMIPFVRNRGTEVIKYLGSSSSLSAAQAVCDHIRDWFLGTQDDHFVTMGVYSNGCYDIPKGLIFGLPVRCYGNFKYEIVEDLKISDNTKENIKRSIIELEGEKNMAL